MTGDPRLCERVQAAAGLYLDRRLEEPARRALRRHLQACEECRGEYAALRQISRLAAGLRRDAAPDDLVKRARATLMDGALRQARRRAWLGGRGLRAAAAGMVAAALVAGGYAVGRWHGGARPAEAAVTAPRPTAGRVELADDARTMLERLAVAGEVEERLRRAMERDPHPTYDDARTVTLRLSEGDDGPPEGTPPLTSGPDRIVLEDAADVPSLRVVIRISRGTVTTLSISTRHGGSWITRATTRSTTTSGAAGR